MGPTEDFDVTANIMRPIEFRAVVFAPKGCPSNSKSANPPAATGGTMERMFDIKSQFTMTRTKIFAGFLLSIAVLECPAKEPVVICARHQYRNGEWSKTERLEATAASGAELNRASGTGHYNSASKYLVVMEGTDDATIIEMSLPRIAFGTIEGIDRRGIRWQLALPPRCPT